MSPQRPGQFAQWWSFVMGVAFLLFALGIGFGVGYADPEFHLERVNLGEAHH